MVDGELKSLLPFDQVMKLHSIWVVVSHLLTKFDCVIYAWRVIVLLKFYSKIQYQFAYKTRFWFIVNCVKLNIIKINYAILFWETKWENVFQFLIEWEKKWTKIETNVISAVAHLYLLFIIISKSATQLIWYQNAL